MWLHSLCFVLCCRYWNLFAPGKLVQCLKQEASTVCCPSLGTMAIWCIKTLSTLPCTLCLACVARWSQLIQGWHHVWNLSQPYSGMRLVLEPSNHVLLLSIGSRVIYTYYTVPEVSRALQWTNGYSRVLGGICVLCTVCTLLSVHLLHEFLWPRQGEVGFNPCPLNSLVCEWVPVRTGCCVNIRDH